MTTNAWTSAQMLAPADYWRRRACLADLAVAQAEARAAIGQAEARRAVVCRELGIEAAANLRLDDDRLTVEVVPPE